MNKALVSLPALLLLGAAGHAADPERKGPPCVVDAFLHAHEKTMQSEADGSSVNELIDLLDENLVYEHPKVGIRIEGAGAYRQGLEAFLGATDQGRYEILDYLVSGDTVAITMNRVFSVQSDGQWKERSIEQMMVFEVRDGKITRMIDYW